MDIKKKLQFIFTKEQRLKFLLLFFILFLGALLELLGVSAIMPLIQVVTNPQVLWETGYLKWAYELFAMDGVNDFLILLVILLIIIYVVKNVYLSFMYYIQYTFVFQNQLKMAAKLIDCYLKKPYTYHLDKNSAEMVRNVMLDTERLFNLILCVLGILSEGMVALFLIVFLLARDFFTTLVMGLVLFVCMGGFLALVRNKVKECGKDNQKYDGKMHQSINQALGAVKDIKILHREKYFVHAFEAYGEKKMRAVRDSSFYGQVPKYVMETVCVLAVLLVVAWKISRGEESSSLISMLTVFGAAAIRLLPSVSKIGNYVNNIIFLKPSIDLIYRDLKETEDMVDYEETDKALPEKEEKPKYIGISHLSYAYPNMSKDVIKDVSFQIPIGASVGFIGPSGAGKSTMADIILGILTPKAGAVSYGTMNVHHHPIQWSKKLAYIPQSIYLADESIKNNVAFGVEEDKIEESLVWKALEEAQLKEFVESLDDGLMTVVGERGVRLSGGQRQRIGIARALYGDPEILVLDEATSALDQDTEKAVMEAIDSLQGKKTLLIIAHRLTTIQNCEIVFSIEKGKVKKVEH